MCIAEPLRCDFEDEMIVLMARVQSCDGRRERYAVFDALMDLEDRAFSGGASALTLRKIAEVRFLVGILREAVRPIPVASLRTVLRICGGGRGPGGAARGRPHAAAESAA
jgi:hypothetical protein